MKVYIGKRLTFLFSLVLLCSAGSAIDDSGIDEIRSGFLNPSAAARPGVYWYFMDGNMSREGITADLESMARVGIGHAVFLEVNVGVPRGKVDLLSDAWQQNFVHMIREAERLGIDITLGVGPGWTGSGGPWVKAEDSMQHLVTTTTLISGAGHKNIKLPVPAPRRPYFGEATLTPELKKQWNDFYKDIAVLAYPAPADAAVIPDIDEKALYYREPYTSVKGVKPRLPAPAFYDNETTNGVINPTNIIDLTDHLQFDGTLNWDVPPGNWNVMRIGARNNGAITRPAPVPGLGFESDKFSTSALQAHLDVYVGKLLGDVGHAGTTGTGGLKALHMDSWEMGSQNWTPHLRDEFKRRRGYDPQPYYPVYAGAIVGSREISERFLWDLRLTAQELVVENHAAWLKKYAHDNKMKLSIEPYDMNPTADLELGSVADIPMAEFWSKGYGFNSAFSCIEAASIAHVNGLPVVQAEAFTGDPSETWHQYPGSMKNQGDWAFAAGINRFFFHTFQHQPLDPALKPGMEMGPYGVHWDRNQTFWPMVGAYHKYIARCQQVLQQGHTVADILYLTPEGAPQVFLPPASALEGDAVLPDRKGYNFDGCSPGQLMAASVFQGRIQFPGTANYRMLVLPNVKTMTPGLLKKITELAEAGAMIVGTPPKKSPSLSGYPRCDDEVQKFSDRLSAKITSVPTTQLYPDYEDTARLLQEKGITRDFISTAPLRYTHRTAPQWDVYFVSNRSDVAQVAECMFRVPANTAPEIWDAQTGRVKALPEYATSGGCTSITLEFAPYQSCFVVFGQSQNTLPADSVSQNFPHLVSTQKLNGLWSVSFDPKWGGPGEVSFGNLSDWTTRPEAGIRYYSGIAIYRKSFTAPPIAGQTSRTRIYLDLGKVNNLARVHLNGHEIGTAWTAPWRVDITDELKPGQNSLEIEVANLWPNRLIGDELLPDDEIRDNRWPDWLLNGQPRPSDRVTFTTYRHYKADSPLLKSGLLGPVTIQQESY